MNEIQRISKLIALGMASEVQMDGLGFDGVLAAKSQGPQMLTCASDVERRGETYRFLLSTETPDRRGDIVRQAGLDLSNFRKNPVALVNHEDTPEGVMGTASLMIDHAGARTWMDVRFSDANPRARMVKALVDEGTIKASSISLLPKKVDEVREKERREKLGLGRFGVVYEQSEVIEGSIVVLPMNAEAVRQSLKAGVEKGAWTPADAEGFDRWGLPTERDLMKRLDAAPAEAATGNDRSADVPLWLPRFEAALISHADRMERVAVTIKQAIACGALGQQSGTQGAAGIKSASEQLLEHLKSRARGG